VFGLAASNIFLGLAVLAAPFTQPLTAVPWRRWRALLWPFGLYVLGLGISVAFSYQPRLSVEALSELFSLLTLAFALVLVRGEAAVRRVVDGLVIAAALYASFGLAQFLWDYGSLDRRIRGPFSHYMTFSGVLLVADLLLLASLSCGGGRRAWRWFAVVLINVALLGSLTRSAWVGLVLALTLLLVLRAPKLLLAYVPAAVLFVALAPVPLLARVISIADLRDVSNYDRICMARAGLDMIRERPLFGLGPTMVEQRYPIYRQPTAPRYLVPHLHNSFLQLAAERGLVSLAAYLWLMIASLRLAWRRYRAEGCAVGPRADLYLGSIVALAAFNLAGIFEYNWGDTEVQRLALFVLALPFCLEASEPAPLTAEGAEPA